jgi:hypothetical protein
MKVGDLVRRKFKERESIGYIHNIISHHNPFIGKGQPANYSMYYVYWLDTECNKYCYEAKEIEIVSEA